MSFSSVWFYGLQLVGNSLKCVSCGSEKEETEFYRTNDRKSGVEIHCIECSKSKNHTRYRKDWFRLQHNIRSSQCRKRSIPYDLTEEYLKTIWTEKCPITGNTFVLYDKTHPDLPTLDRIKPELGYVKGNVVYISSRMNRIKYDASFEELFKLAEWIQTEIQKRNL